MNLWLEAIQPKAKVASLFSGALGLELGLRQLEPKVSWSIVLPTFEQKRSSLSIVEVGAMHWVCALLSHKYYKHSLFSTLLKCQTNSWKCLGRKGRVLQDHHQTTNQRWTCRWRRSLRRHQVGGCQRSRSSQWPDSRLPMSGRVSPRLSQVLQSLWTLMFSLLMF